MMTEYNHCKNKYTCIDLFSGCGGLSEGLRQCGFDIVAAFEIDPVISECYRINHPTTTVITEDIREIKISDVKKLLKGRKLDLLAGCPPCQGFSSVRRLNRQKAVEDEKNSLVQEYFRFIKELKPATIMMENVPWIREFDLLHTIKRNLKDIGYEFIDDDVVNVADYGVPQRRKRYILVGSTKGPIEIVPANNIRKTVRQAFNELESRKQSDYWSEVTVTHTPRIKRMIEMIPKDGGSRKDLPEEYELACHKKPNVGFNDIYGRMKWDEVSPTITGGCLNPSKGRFLHPQENRAITPREAACLQTFPIDPEMYKFPKSASKTQIALMIGNALPPEFARIQGVNIMDHLKKYSD